MAAIGGSYVSQQVLPLIKWESKGVRGDGREARMAQVKALLTKKFRSLEDPASFALWKDIQSGALKCRLLCQDGHPVGVFAHSREVAKVRGGLRDCMDVKLFSLLDLSQDVVALSALFEKAMASVKEENGKSLLFDLGKGDKILEPFLREQHCQPIDTKTSRVVLARLIEIPDNTRGKRKQEEEIPASQKRQREGEMVPTISQPAPSLSFRLQLPEHRGGVVGDRSREYPPSISRAPRQEVARPVLVPQPCVREPLGVTLKRVYIHQIRRGDKTIEGRINTGMFKGIEVDRRVRFFYFSNAQDDVVCRIKQIVKYTSFADMLRMEGFKKCVSEARDFDDAVRIYDSIPGYKEKAARFGVLAFHLEVISGK